jgi:hypothetical protein
MSLGAIVDEIDVTHLTDELDEVVLADAAVELRATPFETSTTVGTQSFVEVDVDLSAERFDAVRAYVRDHTSASAEINFTPRTIPHDTFK